MADVTTTWPKVICRPVDCGLRRFNTPVAGHSRVGGNGFGVADELISVVITCYNLDAYIGSAIGSALAQRQAGPFEVIVVDDASTDGSRVAIERFEGVRLVALDSNGGVMLAMLAGIAASRGDIVCLLDGDDIWEPGKLGAVRQAFRDPGVVLVTHDLDFINAAGDRLCHPSRPRQVLGALAPGKRGEAVRAGILGLGDYVWLGSALSFRRSHLDEARFAAWVGARPDPRNLYQDWPLAYWLAAGPGTMAYVDQPLLCYRLHAANHSGDARTAERAVRNFSRSHNTHAAIATLACERRLDARWHTIAQRRCRLALAQRRFYEGRMARGWYHLLGSVWYLVTQGRLLHELARAFAITLLRPEGLVAVKRRLDGRRA